MKRKVIVLKDGRRFDVPAASVKHTDDGLLVVGSLSEQIDLCAGESVLFPWFSVDCLLTLLPGSTSELRPCVGEAVVV